MGIKEFVIKELQKIASILAAVTVEWGGKDEAQEGKPGRIDKTLSEILESLPVTWEKDKSEFSLANIRNLDEKGIGGRKTWVRANLPGKFQDKDFELKIYRTGEITQYSFHSGSDTSPKVSSRAKVEELFYHFFNVEDKKTKITDENLKHVFDNLYVKKSDLYSKVKEYMRDFVISPSFSIVKDIQKHHIYLKFFAHEDDVKDKEKAVMSKDTLSKVVEDVTEFVSKFEKTDMSKVKITAVFKEGSVKGAKGHVLLITLKF